MFARTTELQDPADATEALVPRARKGDKEAYRKLVERYLPLIFAISWARTTRMPAARRLTTEAFLVIYRKMWAAPRKGFARWLCIIFREDVAPHDSHREIHEEGPLAELARMPLRTRECLAAMCAADMSLGELSATFDESPRLVRRSFERLLAIDGRPPCPRAGHVVDYLDDGISEDQKMKLEMHVLSCDECEGLKKQFDARLDSCRREFAAEMPGEETIDTVMAAIPDAAPSAPKLPPVVRVMVAVWVVTVCIMIASLIVSFISKG